MKYLLIALGAMFVQQTFVSVGRSLPALIAPAILDDLKYDPAWVGIYFGTIAFAALFVQLGCGSFIVRYGSLRLSQVALAMVAVGMAISTEGSMLVWLLSAIIGGGGAAVSTPASSHLLGRYSPPRYTPLVFSIKQTAVPAGILAAGILGPILNDQVGWRGAMLIIAAACFAFAIALQPLRAEFDRDRVLTRSFHLADFKATVMSVMTVPALRSLALACFAFNGLQTVVSAYFVVYLTSLGYTMAAAGFVFSVALSVAVPGRIFWGWLGSGYVAPRVVMAGLALGMGISTVLVGVFEDFWPVMLVGLVASALSATVMSWHGVLLAEAARLAPDGMRGTVTGGVLAAGQVGAMLLPLTYSSILALTGSYGAGFIVCGLPAFVVSIDLLRRLADRDPVEKAGP